VGLGECWCGSLNYSKITSQTATYFSIVLIIDERAHARARAHTRRYADREREVAVETAL
jgi:hypothetical protein